MSGIKKFVMAMVVGVVAMGSAKAGDNGNGTWTVDPGDTLCSIAQEKYGDEDRWQDIYRLNKDKVKNPSKPPVGVVLRLPQ